MSLNEHKIGRYDSGIVDLPDRVIGRPGDLKRAFDARTDTTVRDKHNGLVDALMAEENLRADAWLEGNVLRLASRSPRGAGQADYLLLFDAPASFSEGQRCVVDGDEVTVLDMNGAALKNGAGWASGAPVLLARRGTAAWLISGGGGGGGSGGGDVEEANTAKRLSVPREINGVAFDGSRDITVPAAKAATIIVGTAASGHGPHEVQYLCDGVDDQEEINQALAAAAAVSNGAKVVLREGVYNLTGSITPAVPSIDANLTLEGMGYGTVLRRMFNSASGDGNALVRVAGNNGVLRNVRIDGNKANFEGANNCEVHCLWYHTVTLPSVVENVTIENSAGSRCIWGQCSAHIRNCTINNCIGGVALYGDNSEMTDCRILNATGQALTVGGKQVKIVNSKIQTTQSSLALVSSGEDFTFADNHVECSGTGGGIYLSAKRTRISGNCISAKMYAINVAAASADVVMVGNLIESLQSHAIYFESSAKKCVVAGNRIVGGTRGITLQGSCKEISIIGNHFCRASDVDIKVMGTAAAINIVGNIIRSPEATYSIRIESGVTYCFIDANILAAALSNGGGSTNTAGTNKTVTNANVAI